MSTGTVALKISIDTRRLRRQFSQARFVVGMAGIRFNAAFERIGDRELGRRELAFARDLQTDNTGWDVQVVTTNEGRCRVVARQLGGWA